MYIPYIYTQNSITVITGKPTSIDSSHPNFEKVVEVLTTSTANSVEDILDLMKPIREYRRALATSNFLHDDNGRVYLLVENFPFYLAQELQEEVLRVYRSNGDLRPMEAFVNKLANNPDKDVHQQLYSFIQACGLALTVDGDFLAYKNIRNDYMDIYSGTMDNSVGKVVEMPRFAVEKNPNRTCSAGLHFAAWGYLKHYTHGSDIRTVIVKINPADVVSIPTDYNNMKGRASRYYVVKETERPEELNDSAVFEYYDTDYDDYDDYDEYEENEEGYEDEYCDTCDELFNECSCDTPEQAKTAQTVAKTVEAEINSLFEAADINARVNISII